MNRSLYPVCAIVAWLIVLIKARQLRRLREEPAFIALWSAFLFLALTFTDGSWVVWNLLNRIRWPADAATLVAQTSVACFSASALVLLLLWSYPSELVKRPVVIALTTSAAAVTAMVALFLCAQGRHQFDHKFAQWYGASAVYDAYLLVFLSVYSLTLFAIIWLCWHSAQSATRSWLRSGLRMTACGAVVGLVYAASRLADIAAARMHMNLYPWEDVAEAGAGFGALTMMLGLSMPAWGPRISRATEWLRLLTAHRRLYPLWAALYEWNPDIALDPPRRSHRWREAMALPHTLDYRISRRVIEIRDGMLTMERYITDDIRTSAMSVADGQAPAPTVVARELHSAMAAATYVPALTDTTAPNTTVDNASKDFESEVAWLVAVATAFRRLPPADDRGASRTSLVMTGETE